MEINRAILDIHEDETEKFNFFKRKEDFLIIGPTTGSVNNLNNTGEIIHEVNSTEAFLFLADAFGEIKYSITKRDGTDLNTNITLEHNWPMRIFSNITFEAGGLQKSYTNPGEYDTILKTVMYTAGVKEVSRDYGWIPDTGDSSIISDITLAVDANEAAVRTAAIAIKNRLNNKEENTGYIKRLCKYNKITTAPKRGGTIKLALSPLIGYLDWRKVTKGLPYKFIWTRKMNDTEIFFGAADTSAKLTIESFEIIIPKLRLSHTAEKEFLKSLDKDIVITYADRICVAPQQIESSEYTWNLVNIANMPIALFVAFKHITPDSFTTNNHKYFSYKTNPEVHILQIQLSLDEELYPIRPIIIEPQKQNIRKAYELYERMCSNFGVLPQFDALDYSNIYPVFCFDLSAQEDFIVKNHAQLKLEIKKSSNVPLQGFAVIITKTKKVIKIENGAMNRIE